MGVVVPEGFDLRSLADAAEVRVVEACRDGLSDGWFVMPHVCLTGRRDFELDLVLAHRELGVLDLEVKSHQVSIEAGEWVSSRGPLRPQPYDQARHNAYELRGWLRDRCGAPRLDVDHAVAFPNTAARLAPLPPGIRPQQLITAEELDDLDDALERLMTSRPANRPLGEDLFERIVGSLRPDATVSWDPLARARRARDRLEDICAERVRAVATLDVNRRVAVSGAAGTGKSRLAVSWALRSFAREERTLLTCYNEPLAAWLSSRLPDDDALTVGAFLRMGLALPGLPPCDPPADAGDDWWNVRAVGHLVRHWSSITTRFDTIIVDEAQDFSPAWLALLESLLDPDGARRMLLVADERQAIYQRGFRMPRVDDGWTRAELTANCRNSIEIARLLRRRLDGAVAPAYRPGSSGIESVAIDGAAGCVEAVRSQLSRLDEGGEHRSVMVITVGSTLRDLLRRELGLVPWTPDTAATVCETVHRAKGLDADAVVFVSLDTVADDLLYIGLSRAILALSVVAPREVLDRLGLGVAGS